MENKKSIYKFSLVLNAILIVTLAYTYYSRGTERAAYSRESERGVTSPCPTTSGDCNCICTDYSGAPPFHLINGSLLNQMALNFKATRDAQDHDPDLDRRVYPAADANSVWFALDTLKRFIWEIENRTCNCQPPIKLGIRIYYARYPETIPSTGPTDPPFLSDLIGVPPAFSLMHTVFMIPTFDRPSGVSGEPFHIDFNLEGISDCSLDSINVYDTTFVALMGGKNHGTLCPPICGGTAFGH